MKRLPSDFWAMWHRDFGLGEFFAGSALFFWGVVYWLFGGLTHLGGCPVAWQLIAETLGLALALAAIVDAGCLCRTVLGIAAASFVACVQVTLMVNFKGLFPGVAFYMMAVAVLATAAIKCAGRHGKYKSGN